MIVVKVELWSAVTGEVTNLSTVVLDNIGMHSQGQVADYRARAYRKMQADTLDIIKRRPFKDVILRNHRRLDLHVLTLVKRALATMGY